MNQARVYLKPLRVRAYVLLASADVLSHFGDLFLMVALPLLVYARTGSVLATGLAMAAQWIPFGLLAPVAGVLSDSVDRRRLLALANVAQAICVGLIPFLDRLWLMYGVIMLSSILSSLDESARQAAIPDVLPGDLLAPGLALYQMAGRLASLMGPGLAGVLVAAAGAPWAIWFDACTFLVAGLLAMRIPLPAPHDQAEPPLSLPRVWVQLGEGIRAVHQEGLLRAVVYTGAAAGLGVGGIRMLLVTVIKLSGWPDSSYGYLMALASTAGIFGVLVGGKLPRAIHRRVVLAFPTALAMLLGLVTLAGSRFVTLAAVLMVHSLLGGMYSIAAGTILGQTVTSAFRGRIISLRQSLTFTAMATGSALAGFTTDRFGLGGALVLGLTVLLVGVLPLSFERVRPRPSTPRTSV